MCRFNFSLTCYVHINTHIFKHKSVSSSCCLSSSMLSLVLEEDGGRRVNCHDSKEILIITFKLFLLSFLLAEHDEIMWDILYRITHKFGILLIVKDIEDSQNNSLHFIYWCDYILLKGLNPFLVPIICSNLGFSPWSLKVGVLVPEVCSVKGVSPYTFKRTCQFLLMCH